MTHAPGLSACNDIEKRLAPLSKALAGVVIPHDSCGSYLNPSGETIDLEPEKKNFKVAGKTLSQIWRELVLDGKPVIVEYVESELLTTNKYDEHWVFKHCRISQYMLQVVKLFP